MHAWYLFVVQATAAARRFTCSYTYVLYHCLSMPNRLVTCTPPYRTYVVPAR